MSDILETLWDIIEDRKAHSPSGSYTAQLLAAGLPRIAQKVGEEATETVVAALSQAPERTVSEMADLIYHCMVLLAVKGLTWTDLKMELARRFKVPGAD